MFHMPLVGALVVIAAFLIAILIWVFLAPGDIALSRTRAHIITWRIAAGIGMAVALVAWYKLNLRKH
jgi:hypothetical protein